MKAKEENAMNREELGIRPLMLIACFGLTVALTQPALVQSAPAQCSHPSPTIEGGSVETITSPGKPLTVVFNTNRASPERCSVSVEDPQSAILPNPSSVRTQPGRKQSFSLRAPTDLALGIEGAQTYAVSCEYAGGRPTENFCVDVPYNTKPGVTVMPDPIMGLSASTSFVINPSRGNEVIPCKPGNESNCGCEIALPEYHGGAWAVDTTSTGAWEKARPSSNSGYSLFTPLDAVMSASSLSVMRADQCGRALPFKVRCNYGSNYRGNGWVVGDASLGFNLGTIRLTADDETNVLAVIDVDEQFTLKLTRDAGLNLQNCRFETNGQPSTNLLNSNALNRDLANASSGSATLNELSWNLSLSSLTRSNVMHIYDDLEEEGTVDLDVYCRPHPSSAGDACPSVETLHARVNIDYEPPEPDIEIKRVVPNSITEENQSLNVTVLRTGKKVQTCWVKGPNAPEEMAPELVPPAVPSSIAMLQRTISVESGVTCASHADGSEVKFTAHCTHAGGIMTSDESDPVTINIPRPVLATPTITTPSGNDLKYNAATVRIATTQWGNRHELEYRSRNENGTWGRWLSAGHIDPDNSLNSGAEVSKDLKALKPRTEYQARVRAAAAEGSCNLNSAWSRTGSFTTPPSPTGRVLVTIEQPASKEVNQPGQAIRVRYMSTETPASCRIYHNPNGTWLWENNDDLAEPGGGNFTRTYTGPATLPTTDQTWTYEARCTYGNGPVERNASLTIKAAPQFTITVSTSNIRQGSVSGGGTYAEGTTATVRAAVRTGNIFRGWYEDGVRKSTLATYSFVVVEDRELQARFRVRMPPTPPLSMTITPTSDPRQSRVSVTGGVLRSPATAVLIWAAPGFPVWQLHGAVLQGGQFSLTPAHAPTKLTYTRHGQTVTLSLVPPVIPYGGY